MHRVYKTKAPVLPAVVAALVLVLSLPFSLCAEGFTAIPSAPDFFVAATPKTGFSYYPSLGGNDFGAPTSSDEYSGDGSVDVADMDGDGDNDILFANGRDILLFTNEGSGSFSRSLAASLPNGVNLQTYLRTGDLNEDGRQDFVVGDGILAAGLHMFLQNVDGSFENVALDLSNFPPPRQHWATGAFGMGIGDVDGDGHQDLLLLYSANDQVYFFKGDGLGNMAPGILLFDFRNDWPGTYPPTAASGFALLDFEGDADLDIVIGGGVWGNGSKYFVFINDGSGNFELVSAEPAFRVYGLTSSLNRSLVDTCDFDRDGNHDLLVGVYSSKTIYLVRNGGGFFEEPVIVDIMDNLIRGIGASPAGTEKAKSLEEIIELLKAEIAALPPGTFAKGTTKAMKNKLNSILDSLKTINGGLSAEEAMLKYNDILSKLEKDILDKVDKWIQSEDVQALLTPMVAEIIEKVKAEMSTLE